MTDREKVFELIIAAQAAGEAVQFQVPGTVLELICEKAKVEAAMRLWADMSRSERERAFRSVRKALRKFARQVLDGSAAQGEADAAAADSVLFIAHELAYGQGEKYLSKPTPVADLVEAHTKARAAS